MSLRLRKGEAVGLPPAGEQVFATDATGAAYLLNSDATRASVGGAAAPPLPSFSTVLAADGQTMDLTGCNGETDGGYRIWGKIITPVISGGGGANAWYQIEPNGLVANQNSVAISPSAVAGARLIFAIAPAGTSRTIHFRIEISESVTGRDSRLIEMASYDSNLLAIKQLGLWTDTTTPITSWRITGEYASGGGQLVINALLAGSYVRGVALGGP